MGRLKDKVALITGGNTSIGRAVALAYAQEGADVAIAYHAHEPLADSLVHEVEQRGRRALALHADVTSEAEVQALVRGVVDRLGRIDIFVNNPGIPRPHAITQMKVAASDRRISRHIPG